jgi:hypothetical protein
MCLIGRVTEFPTQRLTDQGYLPSARQWFALDILKSTV